VDLEDAEDAVDLDFDLEDIVAVAVVVDADIDEDNDDDDNRDGREEDHHHVREVDHYSHDETAVGDVMDVEALLDSVVVVEDLRRLDHHCCCWDHEDHIHHDTMDVVDDAVDAADADGHVEDDIDLDNGYQEEEVSLERKMRKDILVVAPHLRHHHHIDEVDIENDVEEEDIDHHHDS